MNNQGTLLTCPVCKQKELDQFGTYRSFGSITPYGEIIIMRKGNHKTFMISKEFTIVCDCGYSIYYNNGNISTGDIPAGYLYERSFNNNRS